MIELNFPQDATPIVDCSGLIPQWVQNLHDLNRVEAENIFKAQKKYMRLPVADPISWFHVKTLKAIHNAMFGSVWEWAGDFRKNVTSIGVKPILIQLQLEELCKDVTFWSQHPVDMSFLERAARIHHRLVFIHPFENGNGRFSRLVADRYLLAYGCKHPIWPDNLSSENVYRKQYIQSLRDADKGDYVPLLNFMKEFGASL